MQLPSRNEQRPQAKEPAGVESAAVGGVQVNGGASALALAGAVSDRIRSASKGVQDARISTSLPGHHKTKKLAKRIGPVGCWHLVCLFLWAAANRSDGTLAGMTDEDVELAADWSGDDGAFVAALKTVGFLDGAEGAYAIHDWEDHNPWAAGAEARSAKSKWAALCKQHGRREAAKIMPEYAVRFDSSSQPNEPSKPDALPDSASGTPVADSGSAPSPSPSPSPSPKQEQEHLHGAEAPSRRNSDQPANDLVVPTDAGTGILIPLKGGSEYAVTNAEVVEWTSAYPDRDVLGELRKARVWCLADPQRKKTLSGVRKFLTGWLARPPFANAPPKHNTTDAYFEGVAAKFSNYSGPTVSLL